MWLARGAASALAGAFLESTRETFTVTAWTAEARCFGWARVFTDLSCCFLEGRGFAFALACAVAVAMWDAETRLRFV